MLKLWTVLSLCFLLTANAVSGAGNDSLNKITEKVRTYGDFELRFSVHYDNGSETSSENGRLILSGDRYSMDLAGTQIFCDGETRYTYIPQNEEVLILSLIHI